MKVLLRTVVATLALLGLLMITVTFTPLVNWWATRLAGPWDDPKGDVLVVLGGSMADTDMLGPNSFLRAQYAVLAWKQDHFKTILVSGGAEPGTPVARLMRDLMVLHGVPENVILLDESARNTAASAKVLKPVLDGMPGRKVLLTSDYHMYRAMAFFKKAGIAIQPRPIPDARKRAASWLGRWPAFLDVAFETAKVLFYNLKGEL